MMVDCETDNDMVVHETDNIRSDDMVNIIDLHKIININKSYSFIFGE